jgi:PAS domain S-box-containing protein
MGESEKRFRQLVENIEEVFWVVSPDWNEVHYISPAYEKVWGRSCESLYEQPRSWLDYVIEEDREQTIAAINRKIAGDFSDKTFPEYRIVRPDGSTRWISARAFEIRDESGEIYRIAGIAEDISERKKAEAALRENEKTLALHAEHLKEVNTALKVLLEHREEEKKQSDENILINLKKLILPYIEKIEKSKLNEKNATYLGIIKSNLSELVSPFANKLSSKYYELTPSEIQIADLIKHGKTSKEIASLLNVSPKAISFHRGNIRKKLGLANKKINLISYLQSFPSVKSPLN